MKHVLLVMFAAAAIFAAGGCPTSTSKGLTASQKAAVDQVAVQTQWVTSILSSAHALADSKLDLDDLDPAGQFGTCPATTFLASSTTVVVQLDFGSGCASTAGETVSGSLDVSITRGPRAALIGFNAFSINGRTVTGTVSGTLARTGASGTVTIAGTVDLTIASVGRISGAISAKLSTTGVVTIDSANLTTTNTTNQAFIVTLDDVVSDPATNSTYLPQSGTGTFSIPDDSGSGTTTIAITFTASTPATATVLVKVGNLPTVEYELANGGA